MRMVFTHDFADDMGAFLGGLIDCVARFIHRIDDAALNGLQAVPRIGDGAVLDNVFGVDVKAIPHEFVHGGRIDYFRDFGGGWFFFFLRHYLSTSLMNASVSSNLMLFSIQTRR